MLLLALLGCASGPDIASGDYRFFTHAMDDACLDGALEALFMPEGADTPHPFEYAVHVPAWDETPQTYEVDFREPFVGMEVTVTSTDEGLAVQGVMDAVLLGEAAYGDCAATMAVDADLRPLAETDGVLVGEARIDISDPRGDDGRCPALDADPCRVRLDLRAERTVAE